MLFRSRLKYYLLFLCLALVKITFGHDFKFIQLSASDWLINSSVNCFAQDSEGFLWIGYDRGLSRYDGQEFITYSIENIKGLPTNSIKSVSWCSPNTILLGTPVGLYALGAARDSLEMVSLHNEYAPYINKMIKVDSLTYVASDIGVHRVEGKSLSHTYTEYSSGGSLHSMGRVSDIAWDKDRAIYIANNDGLLSLEKGASTPRMLLEMQGVTKIAQRSKEGNAEVILASRKGLFIIEIDSEDKVIRRREITHEGRALTDISVIAQDAYDNFWIGTHGWGLYVLSAQGEISHYHSDNPHGLNIDNNYIRDIFVDHSDNIFLSTDASINVIPSIAAFNEISIIEQNNVKNIHAIYCDDDSGALLVGTKGRGLYIVSSDKRSLTHIDDERFRTIRSFLRCENGDFYIGTGGQGLFRVEVDYHKGSIRVIDSYQASDQGHSICDNYIYTLKEDRNNDIWIGTENGLSRLIHSERRAGKRFLNYHHNNNNPNSVRSNAIYSLFIDSYNNIWYGTLYKGFGKIQSIGDNVANQKNATFESQVDSSLIFLNFNTKLNDVSISLSGYSFAEDREKNIWIGTDNGLVQKMFNSSSYAYFTTKDGLSNNSIYSSVIDKHNRMWISTSDGVNSIDLNDFKISRYFKADGLQSNEFNGNAYFFASDGTLYFGGENGINIINTNKLPNSVVFDKKVVISKIVVDDSPQLTSQIDSITVLASVASLEIHASSLDFVSPLHESYNYQIVGLSDEWVSNGQNNIIKINGLPPGEYDLNIECETRNGEVATTVKALHITVLPPAYRSVWAILAYIAILSAIGYYIVQKRRDYLAMRQLITQNNASNKQVEESLVFFTNVLHELRSSLMLVVSPIESLLKSSSLSYQHQSKLSLTYRNSRKLQNLIEEAISIRKLNKEDFKLNVEHINIGQFLDAALLPLSDYSNTKSINLNSNFSQDLSAWVDAAMLDKMICNLVLNAIKFSNAGGEISIYLESIIDNSTPCFILSVEDNGIGIDQEDIPKICDRFYQAKHNRGGMGIGLHLTKYFAELHQGRLEIESQVGVGSKFSIIIPTQACEPTSDLQSCIGAEITDFHRLSSLVKEHSKPDIVLNTKRKSVLIADDNIDMLSLIATALEDEYNIFRADNGNDALLLAVKHRPEIVITDLVMPQLSGAELCRSIRENRALSEVYVIVVSATDSETERAEAIDAGGDIFMPKPFNMEYLRSVVELRMQEPKVACESISNETQLVYDQGISSLSNKFAATSSEELFIKRFNTFILDNITNEDLSVEMFAESMQMSRSNFYRIIKKITGKSPIAIILWTRMAVAADLLVMNTLSISEIAYKVGYSDPKYFAKVFKKHYGKSPSEYAHQFGGKG